MLTILLFLLILAILIFVHELGHFLTAKMFGVQVDEFGLGFPPRIFGKKIGETTYTLNAIPLGGFVKIFGEDPVVESTHYRASAEDNKNRSFQYKPKWMQAIILSAGVCMNILFGYLLLSTGFMMGLPASVSAYPAGQVKNVSLVITSVLPNSPADKAGLIAGDLILGASVGQETLKNPSPDSVANLILKSQSPVSLIYRQGDDRTLHIAVITPSDTLVPGSHVIGITMDMVGILKLSVGSALIAGAQTTGQLLKGIVVGLWQFFGGLGHFSSDISQVSGPVGIAKIVGQASSIGFVYLMSLVALISLNLAVINLIPFPALDGGRLLFVIIEAISRKRINARFVQWTNALGFAFLIVLMVFITIHDVFGVL